MLNTERMGLTNTTKQLCMLMLTGLLLMNPRYGLCEEDSAMPDVPEASVVPDVQVAPSSRDDSGVVLDEQSYWRCHLTLRTPLFGTTEVVPNRWAPFKYVSEAPPAKWLSPDFDDGSWWRTPGPFFGGYGLYSTSSRGVGGLPPTIGMIALRGRFVVQSPERAGDLTLTLRYRGGAVVYLNGQEIARGFMPEGALTPETPATVYPWEVYTIDGQKPIIDNGKNKDAVERLEKRIRKLEKVGLPPAMLRKGVNILAIELHRAVHPEEALKLNRDKGWWSTVGLVDVRLTSKSKDVVPNLVRPEGIQLWSVNPMQSVYDVDYGDPCDAEVCIKLDGTRNGAFSGQVVVSSEKPINGLKATVTDLKRADGSGVIPASAIKVRYARPGGVCGDSGFAGLRSVTRFDDLMETAPAQAAVQTKTSGRTDLRQQVFGAVQPVWVTVEVPKDAPAGEYKGVLKITAEGFNGKAMIAISVADWSLPPPAEWRTMVDMIQSPDSVALHYNVPMWSDKHFDLMAKSFKLLGQAGNKTVYVPLICYTHFGNAESMVRWVKKGGADAGGSYAYDFKVLERYLDMVEANMGKPEIVCLYVWEQFSPGGFWSRRHKDEVLPQTVSLVDESSGKVTPLDGPKMSEKEAFPAFWKPMMQELRARLAKRGLDKAMMLGIVADHTPTEGVIRLWQEIDRDLPWFHQGHGKQIELFGQPVRYTCTVWKGIAAVDPDIKRTYGWNQKKQTIAYYHRDLVFSKPINENRLLGEYNIQGGQRGFGRNGADFWPVLDMGKGGKSALPNRYPQSNMGQLSVKTAFLAPGPDGAVSTVRLEMIREGVQECEARIFIESALLDKNQRAKLGEERASRLQALCDARTRATTYGWENYGWFVSSGWQARSGKLFQSASEVAQVLGIR